MKHILTFLLVTIFILSCKKEGEPYEEEVNIKEITATIELASGSTLDPSDLKVSSILTEGAPVVNSTATIKAFDDEAIEMAFATNAQGNLLLATFFDPLEGETIQLNTENTAIALVMMHPWSMDLSVSGKKEAFTYIRNLPEFAELKLSIDNSIKSGNIDPLVSTAVINKILLTQKKVFSIISEYKEPLQFEIEKSKITIYNKVSSAAYSVSLYDKDGKLISNKMVDGMGKFQYTMSQFLSNSFFSFDVPEVSFNTPVANGNYTLKASSGLSFNNSNENLYAAFENSRILMANTIGIFSFKLRALVRLNVGKCGSEIGSFVYNGRTNTFSIAASLKEYSENKKSNYQMVKDVIVLGKERYDGIVKVINSCSSNPYGLKSETFKIVFKYLDLLSSFESAFNGGAHLADWLQFDKSIETCFQKSTDDVQPCNLLLGKWKLTGLLLFGNEVFSSLQACDTDNTLTFSNNNLFTMDEGPSKCSPTDPQTETGTYTYDVTNKILTWATSFDSYHVRELTATNMKLENVLPNKSEIITYTRQP